MRLLYCVASDQRANEVESFYELRDCSSFGSEALQGEIIELFSNYGSFSRNSIGTGQVATALKAEFSHGCVLFSSRKLHNMHLSLD